MRNTNNKHKKWLHTYARIKKRPPLSYGSVLSLFFAYADSSARKKGSFETVIIAAKQLVVLLVISHKLPPVNINDGTGLLGRKSAFDPPQDLGTRKNKIRPSIILHLNRNQSCLKKKKNINCKTV